MSSVLSQVVTLPRLVEVTKTACTVVGGVLGDEPYTVKRLLSDGDDNPKTKKNRGVITRGLSLLPHRMAGYGNLCPFADSCADSCLQLTGRGMMDNTIRARAGRTLAFLLARDWSIDCLVHELSIAQLEAKRSETDLAVRMNMLSDFPWESTGLIDQFPQVRFYDYTKNPNRWGAVRPNYWVTFSRGSDNQESVESILSEAGNVAVVFHNPDGRCGKAAARQTLPDTYLGYRVIDGRVTDLRDEDERGVVVGLSLLARKICDRQAAIDSGFSVEYAEGA